MKSPVGNHSRLVRTELEPKFHVYQCPETHGIWFSARSYWRWVSSQPSRLEHVNASDKPAPPSNFDGVPKFCPESGTLMASYAVGHEFSFRIERSVTGGIWLDGGEWEQLKSRNYHDELHLIFTAPWQREERKRRLEAATESAFREKLGSDLYDRLSKVCDELKDHPFRDEALALLCRGMR